MQDRFTTFETCNWPSHACPYNQHRVSKNIQWQVGVLESQSSKPLDSHRLSHIHYTAKGFPEVLLLLMGKKGPGNVDILDATSPEFYQRPSICSGIQPLRLTFQLECEDSLRHTVEPQP